MNNQTELLPVKNREDLRTVCASLELGDFFEMIEEQAQFIQWFDRYGKAEMKSARGRIKALEKVATAAKVLAAAISELDAFEKSEVARNLPPDGLRTGCEIVIRRPGAFAIFHIPCPSSNCHVQYPIGRDLHGRVGHIGIEAERLSKYCGEICRDENTSGVKGGRKNTLDRYAYFIGNIWNAIQGQNINLGRGGPFEQLCEAVFIAAGVRTGPEGAIRRFNELRKTAENTPDDEPF